MRALLIPADLFQPVAEIQIDGADGCLEALQALVGGSIETIPHPTRDDVAPYFNEEGKLLELAPNWRATELLRESIHRGDYIAGDCVLAGFDSDTGETTELPGDYEIQLSAPIELGEPDAVKRKERSITYDWLLSEGADGKRTLAVLTVSHHRAGVNFVSGRSHPNEFTATLGNETEEPVSCGGVMRGFTLFSAIAIDRQEVGRFSAKRLDEFAQRALARLCELCAAGDPRVLRYFQTSDDAAEVTA